MIDTMVHPTPIDYDLKACNMNPSVGQLIGSRRKWNDDYHQQQHH
jgi:hypothetical protein